MTLPHDMPPDPWAEDGIDLWTLEEAERLAQDGVTGDDPRWRALEDDGPLIDDFDGPAAQNRYSDSPEPFSAGLRRWVVGAVAAVLLLALLLYFIR